MVCRYAMNLIELLVVIFIIALLLCLLLGSLNLARQKAIQIHCVSNLKQVTAASLSYTADFSIFPGYVSRRPYGDFLTGRTSSAMYTADDVMRCPGIVHWRGRPYERLRIYGIYEVDPADPVDASLDSRTGRFWEYRKGAIGDDMLFFFERVKGPSSVSLWRDCVIISAGSGERPHWKYRRTIADNYGAKLSHLRRSSGGYLDGHVECKNLTELHDEPYQLKAVYNAAGGVMTIP